MTDAAPIRASATLFTTWRRCSKAALARVDGHYPADTIHTFRGLLAHRIFARHYQDGPIPVTDFNLACRQEIGKSQLNWKMKEIGLTYRQVEGIIMVVADYYRRFRTLARGLRVSEVEAHVEAEFGDHTLVGRIDAVVNWQTSAPRLIDWKAGELGDTALPQLRFYSLVYSLARTTPLSVEAVSITTGEKIEEWVDHKTNLETTSEVVEMIADLTTRSVAASPGPWCQWCPILEECEEGQRARALVS